MCGRCTRDARKYRSVSRGLISPSAYIAYSVPHSQTHTHSTVAHKIALTSDGNCCCRPAALLRRRRRLRRSCCPQTSSSGCPFLRCACPTNPRVTIRNECGDSTLWLARTKHTDTHSHTLTRAITPVFFWVVDFFALLVLLVLRCCTLLWCPGCRVDNVCGQSNRRTELGGRGVCDRGAPRCVCSVNADVRSLGCGNQPDAKKHFFGTKI